MVCGSFKPPSVYQLTISHRFCALQSLSQPQGLLRSLPSGHGGHASPSVPGSQSCCPPALPIPALLCTSKGTSWPSQPARPRLPAKSSFFHFRGFSRRAKSFLSLWRAASFQRNFSIRVTASQHVRGCEAAAINLYNIMAKIMFSLTE